MPDLNNQIEKLEESLREAMRHSDIISLNNLLADDLIFTNHLGQILTKQDDIAAHRDGVVRIHKLECSGQLVQVLGDVAVVTVLAEIDGVYAGQPAAGRFRFTRVWAYSEAHGWQVIVAHSSQLLAA